MFACLLALDAIFENGCFHFRKRDRGFVGIGERGGSPFNTVRLKLEFPNNKKRRKIVVVIIIFYFVPFLHNFGSKKDHDNP